MSCSKGAGRGTFLSPLATVWSFPEPVTAPDRTSQACPVRSGVASAIFQRSRWISGTFQEPLIRGGFVVLRFLLCLLVFGVVFLRLGVALR